MLVIDQKLVDYKSIGVWKFTLPHLSKGTSGCKQKCAQHWTPFSDTAFHALPCGTINFVLVLALKTLQWKFDWLFKLFNDDKMLFQELIGVCGLKGGGNN